MKNKIFTLMLIVCSSLFLVNCAKNNSSGTNANQAAYGVNGNCPVGYINTTLGCGQQSANCPANYGYINGSCQPAVANGIGGIGGSCQAGYVYTQMGCLPQSQMCGANYMQYGYGNGQCYPVTTNGIGIGGVGGTCQAGYVGTAMGCLPQGTCPVNYGYYYGVYQGQTGGWCYPRSY